MSRIYACAQLSCYASLVTSAEWTQPAAAPRCQNLSHVTGPSSSACDPYDQPSSVQGAASQPPSHLWTSPAVLVAPGACLFAFPPTHHGQSPPRGLQATNHVETSLKRGRSTTQPCLITTHARPRALAYCVIHRGDSSFTLSPRSCIRHTPSNPTPSARAHAAGGDHSLPRIDLWTMWGPGTLPCRTDRSAAQRQQQQGGITRCPAHSHAAPSRRT